MAIAGDGGLRVEGPACRPSKFGLKTAADVSEVEGDEWARGLEWDELPCGVDVGLVSGQCPALPEQLKERVRGFGQGYSDPFAVYAGWECSAGTVETGKAWDIADELFRRNLWRGLELALWTGVDQDANPIQSTLATPDATDLTPGGGAVSLVGGLRLLEEFAGGCSDCEPIVHANRGLGPLLASKGLIYRDGDVQRLVGTGSLYVGGGGYPGTGPGGSVPPAGETWLYVSGGVGVVLGQRFFTPERGDLAGAVDRLTNDLMVYAESFAAIQVGCCVGAVRITLT